MSENRRKAQLLADERLLDRLAAGEQPGWGEAATGPGDSAAGNGHAAPEEVAGLLATWRADLETDLPQAPLDLAAVGVPTVAAAAPAPRGNRWRRLVAGAGVAAVLAGGGGAVAVAAGGGQPGGGLWPITQLLYPDRAESRAAQQEAEELLDAARAAIAEHRYADAERLLSAADPLVRRVSEPGEQQGLRDALAEVQRALHELGLPPTDAPDLESGRITDAPAPGLPDATPTLPALPDPGAPLPPADAPGDSEETEPAPPESDPGIIPEPPLPLPSLPPVG